MSLIFKPWYKNHEQVSVEQCFNRAGTEYYGVIQPRDGQYLCHYYESGSGSPVVLEHPFDTLDQAKAWFVMAVATGIAT